MVYQWVLILPALAYYLSRAQRCPVSILVLNAFHLGLYVNRYVLGIQDVASPFLGLPSFTPLLAILMIWISFVAKALRSASDY